ncbi:MAG TPA: carbohydrate kinase [Marinobacterium sp.]|nr:carbohydrate kinase [Marinobacterium sp.]
MFLACGDALYDVFPGESASSGEITLNATVGGSPLNVAIGLARLGNPTGYLTANSKDALGQKLKRHLETNGIVTDFLAASDLNTSLAMIALNEQGHPSYSFYLEGCADVSLRRDQCPDPSLFKAISLGSYSTVVEPIASTLEWFASQAREQALIAYDPNVRPSIQPDAQVWHGTVEKLGRLAHVMKLSDEDIAFLAPDSSIEAYARFCLTLGPQWVFVTKGGEGSEVYGQDGQHFSVAAPKISVKDTVGAGDTFQAAMIHEIFEQGGPANLKAIDAQRVCTFASHAAALTCERIGADLPSRKAIAERWGL